MCNIGKIQERELCKQAKYTELRAEIKRLYKVKEIQQINAVFEFLAGYNKTLEENLRHFTDGKQTASPQLIFFKPIPQCIFKFLPTKFSSPQQTRSIGLNKDKNFDFSWWN